jgi:hypothetical protein
MQGFIGKPINKAFVIKKPYMAGNSVLSHKVSAASSAMTKALQKWRIEGRSCPRTGERFA